MRHTKKEKPKKSSAQEPNRYQEISPLYSSKVRSCQLRIPSQFRLLCALLETPPEHMLEDFMNNAGFTSSGLGNGARLKAQEYLMQCGYGSGLYTAEQLALIFKEMEAQRCLWPEQKSMDMERFDMHATWHHMYMEYWFEKWYWKVRCEGEEGVLADY